LPREQAAFCVDERQIPRSHALPATGKKYRVESDVPVIAPSH
jgi:hypothetical protein